MSPIAIYMSKKSDLDKGLLFSVISYMTLRELRLLNTTIERIIKVKEESTFLSKNYQHEKKH
jgi:D-alanyl-lipoteichoic acid acyltransferase DltB (MBOAT superfamily)